MTAHLVMPPRRGPSGAWHTACTCGLRGIGESVEEARSAMQACRDAEKVRMGGVYDRERDEARRRRREARRETRRTAVRAGKSSVEGRRQT